MDLYFVRHGKTEWNLEGKYQGSHGDSPLLPESIHDIGLLAKRLKNIPIRHAYSSPILRARRTAEILLEDLGKKIPLTEVDGLKEFDLGDMEGKKFVDLEARIPDVIHAFRQEPAKYDATKIHGESFESVIKRSNDAINRIVAKTDPDASILLVSHGAALVAMIQALLGTKIADLRKNGGLSNSSLTHLKYENGKYSLVKWNETKFLNKKLESTDTI
ncbi:histidine phosphatase family protein [Companilactobacillus sp.]|jgi:probable phosphoglycerate mutase|uniref:histidine phosphatase family protein n=1 Tax=Companilactobacillus sp. TaxID=2767905 RepID=UPI0025C22701|nr:histidine phosphatase family protein [Companilactobacillus sp.]MCH4008430.1 histidine phosphatase family protein [Companilactobacillus sp.]MCH4051391.1 histidine phosphatase family protein [Companilactobacillus sp.]MCH4076373.1 histidine phosphatase family protein [Companilactobacillus sp.]MCH4124948.1 histidine phosphatase family protein [Companilactobacillus sp.]MCH4131490.1 histidine phosphatase family protein [Companilactobacillus sp.]